MEATEVVVKDLDDLECAASMGDCFDFGGFVVEMSDEVVVVVATVFGGGIVKFEFGGSGGETLLGERERVRKRGGELVWKKHTSFGDLLRCAYEIVRNVESVITTVNFGRSRVVEVNQRDLIDMGIY